MLFYLNKLILGISLITGVNTLHIDTLGFNNLRISIDRIKEKVVNHSDLDISIRFSNGNKNVPIVLPRHPEYGSEFEINLDQVANIIFEVERLTNIKFEKQKPVPHHAGMALSYPPSEMYDTLKYRKDIIHKFPIDALYSFTKGTYRVRAKYLLSPFSKFKKSKFIYSNWMKFTVEADSL